MARRPHKTKRRGEGGMSKLAVGSIAMVVIVIVSYLAFTKNIPFTHGYEVSAVFQSSNEIKKSSPVRIAGVNVGKVVDVQRYKNSNLAVVKMEIQKTGLPIHSDAQVAIRPRIFLEGNFFVDLKPGSPSKPTISSGGTIPVTQTSTPVQLDQVLSALQSDTRANLQDLLQGYGQALSQKPPPGGDPGQGGGTGAEALRRATRNAPEALKGASIVNEALLGTEPHDLSKLIGSLASVTKALNSREVQLKDLVTQFNTTMAATAAESTSLRASIHLLAPTLATSYRTLGDVEAALPSTRAFARELIPGVKETGPTINAAFPWIRQVRGLVGPNELQGDAVLLRKATPDLAGLIDGTTRLLPQIDLIDRCASNVILPAGNIPIHDGSLTAKRPDGSTVENYKEFWYSLEGITGEGQNFDGNGMYVRFQPGGGLQTVSTGTASLSGDTLLGKAPDRPIGTRPIYPGAGGQPKFHPDVACYTQKLPDINGSADIGPPDKVTATDPVGTPTGILAGLTDGILPSEVTPPPLPTLPPPPLPLRKRSAAPKAKAAPPARGTSTTPTTTAPATTTPSTGKDTAAGQGHPLGAIFGGNR